MTDIQFKDWRCKVQQGRYSNGRVALKLVDAEDGDPIATATVNLPDEPCEPNEVYVKSYSENEGMLQALLDAGIVHPPTSWVESGHVRVPRCKLVER